MKVNLNNNKGITLIALIITIIVLLILAVVSINLVVNQGIIIHAENATSKYTVAEEKEKISLGYTTYKMSKTSGKTDATLTVEGAQVVGDETVGWTITFDKTKNIYSLTTEGTATEETFEKATVDTIADKKSTIDGKAPSANNPVIPAGFKPINTETSAWDAEGGPEVDKGLVISDGTSEFVWVPVTTTIENYGLETNDYREPDVVTNVTPSDTVNSASGSSYDAVPANLKRAGFDTTDLEKNDLVKSDGTEGKDDVVNAYDFKQQLTNEFNAMANSINNKYHGFYVGRYEMSLNASGIAQSKQDEKTLYNDKTENDWYGLYAKAKTYTNPKDSVGSSMIWGSQYDAMMKWMEDKANTTIGDDRNMDPDRKTGTAPKDIIKNVYDLYGNSREWTLEASNTGHRVNRGGYYNDSYAPSGRYSYSPTITDGHCGSRLTLYAK